MGRGGGGEGCILLDICISPLVCERCVSCLTSMFHFYLLEGRGDVSCLTFISNMCFVNEGEPEGGQRERIYFA